MSNYELQIGSNQEHIPGQPKHKHPRKWVVASTTGVQGWAAELAAISIYPLALIAPQSVAAKLAAAALPLEFDRINRVMIPKVTTPPTALWVGEGDPHPVGQSVLGSVQCGPPRKILIASAVTREIAVYAPNTALAVVKRTRRHARSF